MTITSISTRVILASTTATPDKPVIKNTVDPAGTLYKTSSPDDPADTSAFTYMYGKKGLAAGSVVPTSAVYLKNADGTYFSVDFGDTSKVSIVAAAGGLDLYVYSSAGAADKYSFTATGLMKGEEAASVDALEVSKQEALTKTDLDQDGVVGARLVATATETEVSGVLDATGGLYKVSALGTDMYVVGTGLEKPKTVIDASTSALLNDDGSLWAPEAEFASLRLFSRKDPTANALRYYVYGTSENGEVTRYTFNESRKLMVDSAITLSAEEMARDEKIAARDLDNDTYLGVQVDTTAVDATGGLFQGSVLGKNFYLINKLAGWTQKTATDTSGALVDAEGLAWTAPDGYSITALVNTQTSKDKGALPLYTVIATKDDDPNDVLRFNFTQVDTDLTGADNKALIAFKVTDDSAEGIAQSATDLAALEKTFKRDLNQDSVFGVQIQGSAVDGVVGLYRASALGHDFLVVGKSLVSNQSKPLDLTTALVTAEGEAWLPDDVAEITNQIRIVETKADNKVIGYQAYLRTDSGTFMRYTFGGADATSPYVLDGEGEELTREQLAAAEVSTRRDLNNDGAFGVVITQVLDAKSGLYQGEFEEETVFLRSDVKLALGSKVASKAVDLSKVLKTADGLWVHDSTEMTISAAYVEDDNFYLVSRSTADPAMMTRYAFANDTGVLDEEASGEFSLAALTTAESTLKRDLNNDGTTGVKITTTLDKTGGLFVATTAGQGFLVYGKSVSAIKDLSTAFLDTEGNAWDPGDSTTAVMVVQKKEGEDVSGFDIYRQLVTESQDGQGNPSQTTTYVRTSFDANFRLIEDSDAELSVIALADEEVAISRDLNGDKSIGAKITQVLDKTSGLYQVEMDGQAMLAYVDPATSPGKAIALEGRVLLADDGVSPWSLPLDYVGRAVVDKGEDGLTVYASHVPAGGNTQFWAFRFTPDRVASESAQLTVEEFIAVEKELSRDLNGDKAVGLAVDTKVIDRKGGLYKAGVLGQTYYVLGQNLKSGKDTASAVDLSKALLTEDGSPWDPVQSGQQIAGVLTQFGDDGTTVTGYAVFTYVKDDTGVQSVQRSSWSVLEGAMTFEGTEDADPVMLVELEKEAGRDLSGDGVIGFRLNATANSDPNRNYFGVSQAMVFGSMSFFLAGEKLRQGSATNPLSLKDALLNEDGTGPWALEAGYQITAVEEDTANSLRYVYAATTSDQGKQSLVKYAFSSVDGRVQGESQSVSAFDLADKEVKLKRDLNRDSKTGVATVSPLPVNGGKESGLLQASVMGNDYLVVQAAPKGNKPTDLSKVLLNDDGTAWQLPAATDGGAGFELRGVYQRATDTIEVYGLVDTQITRFKFTQSSEQAGAFVLAAESDTDPRNLTGTMLAKDEATAGRDLNGDGAIGFQVRESLASQSNGWAVGKAGAGPAPEDEIFIVGKNLAKLGATAKNTANAAALFFEQSSELQYWRPDSGYQVQSLWQTQNTDGTPKNVNIYAVKPGEEGATPSYLKYTFTQNTDKFWVLENALQIDPAQGMDLRDLVADEVSAKRDLSGDGTVGLNVMGDAEQVAGLFKASIENQEFLIIGRGLKDGTTSKPLGFSGLLVDENGAGAAWKPADEFTITAVWQATASTAYVYATQPPAEGSEITEPVILKYEFELKADGDLAGKWALKAAVDTSAGLDGKQVIFDEVVAKRDLDGNGVVGLQIVDSSADTLIKSARGLYKVQYYDTTAYIASPNATLATGTAAKPLGGAGVLATNSITELTEELTLWDPAAESSLFAIKAMVTTTGESANKLTLYGTNKAEGGDTEDANSAVKYEFDEVDSPFGKHWKLAGEGVTTLTAEQLVADEATYKRDLNGDGVVGLDIQSTAVEGLLFEARAMGQTYYLIGKGLVDGTAANPLGLSTALKASADAYWTPGEGASITAGTRSTVTSLPAYVQTPPEGWSYALQVTTGETATTVYFDASYTQLTASGGEEGGGSTS